MYHRPPTEILRVNFVLKEAQSSYRQILPCHLIDRWVSEIQGLAWAAGRSVKFRNCPCLELRVGWSPAGCVRMWPVSWSLYLEQDPDAPTVRSELPLPVACCPSSGASCGVRLLQALGGVMQSIFQPEPA